MQKLSMNKQIAIVRLYLAGYSYDEIAAEVRVSKGTVANVVADLKAGRILDIDEPAEQIEIFRELAVDLRRCRLTPGQAVVGITVLSRLQELGLEPPEIGRWAAICRELAGKEAEAQAFARAALALEELRKRTGLSADGLEEKVRSLEEEAARLEPLRQELDGCQQHLEESEKRRQKLAEEVAQLEKRYEPLRRSVIEQERREAELSRRVQELEKRAQTADERLAVARRELQTLAGLGLSLDELAGFVQTIAGVAQRQHIQPEALRDRLLHELEELEAGLGLESLLELRQRELSEIEETIAKAQRERVSLDSALQQLHQQQASLHATIKEEQAHIRKEMRALARIAGDTVTKLQKDLGRSMAEVLLEVQRLRNQALELGQELGRYDAAVEANQWLYTMVALVKGDGGIRAADVRLVGLAVLRGVKNWMRQNTGQISLPYWLTTQVNSAVEQFEQWRL